MTTLTAYASINISGEVKAKADFDNLVQALADEYARPDYLETIIGISDGAICDCEAARAFLLCVVRAGNTIKLCVDEARNGKLDVEDVCREIGLWFWRYNASDYGLDAMDITYNPITHELHSEPEAQDGHYIPLYNAMKVLETTGPEGLAEFVRKRDAECSLATGSGMPAAFTVSDDVLSELLAKSDMGVA